jgi:hypothetical protein
MSVTQTVAVAVDKYLMSPTKMDGNVFPREENKKFVEYLEIDLGWMHRLRASNAGLVNYEMISSNDVLSHPFSFQPIVTKSTSSFSSLHDVLCLMWNKFFRMGILFFWKEKI